MSSLCSLPALVLEDILSFVVGLAPPSTSLKRKPGVEIRKGEVVKKLVALPLLLSCRQLHDVVIGLVLSRATFRLRDKESLQALFDIIPGDRLPHLKNVTLFLGDPNPVLGHYNVNKSELEVEEYTNLMSRLPEALPRLHIDLQHGGVPTFSARKQTHPFLQRSLWRLQDLHELCIDAGEHYFHVELFTAVRFERPWYIVPHNMNFMTYYRENKSIPWDTFEQRLFTPPRPAPMFPKLSHLTISGSIALSVTPELMTEAFSEKHLPSLTHLAIDGLLWDESPEGMDPPAWVFSPECLQSMHPLIKFDWTTFDIEDITKMTQSNPHIPPMRGHVEALKDRHGATLSSLRIIYDGWMYDFEEEEEDNWHAVDPRSIDWDAVMACMPKLRTLQISCIERGIQIDRAAPHDEWC